MKIAIEIHNSTDYTYANGVLSRMGYDDVTYHTYVSGVSDADRATIAMVVTETLFRILREQPSENIPRSA